MNCGWWDSWGSLLPLRSLPGGVQIDLLNPWHVLLRARGGRCQHKHRVRGNSSAAFLESTPRLFWFGQQWRTEIFFGSAD